MKKKFLAFMLSACMVFGLFPSGIYAYSGDNAVSKETYTDVENDFTLERIIEGDTVTVFVKSLEGKALHSIVNDGRKLFLDGKVVDEAITNSLSSNPARVDVSSLGYGTLAITWGSWSTTYEDIPTGGLPVAVIAGLIAAFAPWAPVKTIGVVAAAAAGKYDYITVKIRIRYGYDSQYQYYQRETSFYGDGVTKIGSTVSDSGKEPLD